MKHPFSLASPLYPKICCAFTAQLITVWVGTILLPLYFELIALRAVLQMTLVAPLAKRSTNQIPVMDAFLACSMGWP